MKGIRERREGKEKQDTTRLDKTSKVMARQDNSKQRQNKDKTKTNQRQNKDKTKTNQRQNNDKTKTRKGKARC